MKYLWAVMLIILDLIWICFTIYDFVYSARCTNEYIKDTNAYRDREASLFTWLGEFFTEVEGSSLWCVTCHVLALFIHSLVLYLHSLG